VNASAQNTILLTAGDTVDLVFPPANGELAYWH
jgi:hypothetical protein